MEKEDSTAAFPPRVILVALDFSEHSASTVAYAINLARFAQAELTFLHVLGAADDLPSVPFYHDIVTRIADSELKFQAAYERACEELARLEIQARDSQVTANSCLQEGIPRDEIVTAAKRFHSDLVVIGSHGSNPITRLLLGSTADHVVRHAPCPVLVVRKGSSGGKVIGDR
jgi:universal stress protein A